MFSVLLSLGTIYLLQVFFCLFFPASTNKMHSFILMPIWLEQWRRRLFWVNSNFPDKVFKIKVATLKKKTRTKELSMFLKLELKELWGHDWNINRFYCVQTVILHVLEQNISCWLLLTQLKWLCGQTTSLKLYQQNELMSFNDGVCIQEDKMSGGCNNILQAVLHGASFWSCPMHLRALCSKIKTLNLATRPNSNVATPQKSFYFVLCH